MITRRLPDGRVVWKHEKEVIRVAPLAPHPCPAPPFHLCAPLHAQPPSAPLCASCHPLPAQRAPLQVMRGHFDRRRDQGLSTKDEDNNLPLCLSKWHRWFKERVMQYAATTAQRRRFAPHIAPRRPSPPRAAPCHRAPPRATTRRPALPRAAAGSCSAPRRAAPYRRNSCSTRSKWSSKLSQCGSGLRRSAPPGGSLIARRSSAPPRACAAG